MLEVLHRQTEFNLASEELISGLESKIEALHATLSHQTDELGKANERIRSLERKLQEIDRQRAEE